MMHGQGKSDGPIVLGKPSNKPACAGAEGVEGRGAAKGNPQERSMRRTQDRASMQQALSRRSTLRRHVFEPLCSLYSRSPMRGYWKELEKTQYQPLDMLLERQWNRLRSLLSFSYTNNAFYRKRFDDAGLSPQDIRSAKDIMRLPILTKKEIREHTEDMISQGYLLDRLMKVKTGGSSGKALELYLTEECSELRNACARRHDRWTGWEVGEPIGGVWGNPVLPFSLKDKLKELLLGQHIYLDTMNVTDQAVLDFARQWIKIRPTLLFGHAHSLFVLAECVRRLEIKDINPKGILSTSMMLMPHERKTIESVFGIKVTDRYGCEEVSLIASECEKHEGMHQNIEHLFIEFVKGDGTIVAPGEPGRIIVTDLMNKAMPLIRYDVEDVGVSSDKKCSCGRGLPLMEHVTGRVADFLIKKDGSRVAGVSLIENTLTEIPGIDQMQIVQELIDSLVIRVVPGSDFRESTRTDLSAYFKNLFGDTVAIEIQIASAIQPEESGKYRFSICRISQ